MTAELQTIGYEGHDTESFLWLLEKAGTELVVDVRWSARSRNRDFNRGAIEAALARAGIGYLHVPELGVPPEVRAKLKQTADLAAYRRRYGDYLKTKATAVQRIHALAGSKACCLMCLESRADRCHRSVLAERLAGLDGQRMSVTHL